MSWHVVWCWNVFKDIPTKKEFCLTQNIKTWTCHSRWLMVTSSPSTVHAFTGASFCTTLNVPSTTTSLTLYRICNGMKVFFSVIFHITACCTSDITSFSKMTFPWTAFTNIKESRTNVWMETVTFATFRAMYLWSFTLF